MASSSPLLAASCLLLLLLAPSVHAVSSIVCIPTTMALMEDTEGRHKCAYDSDLGYRAVGVGYNLDDRSVEREKEISTVFSDYDKVYDGKECLNDVQINALLTFDARRSLLKASKRVPSLDNWCCNVQAVSADIAFALGQEQMGSDFDKTIQRTEHQDWPGAAKSLKKTQWCEDNEKVCSMVREALKKGCSSSTVGEGYIQSLRGYPFF